jgi:energy-coupling factor transporter transmembrane protein EcfT
MIKPDPRTHLIVLIMVSVLSMLVNSQLQMHAMVAASAVYLISLKLTKRMAYFVFMYIVFLSIAIALPDAAGVLIIVFYTIARIIPLIMIGAALLRSAPGSIMCALERSSFPKPIVVMICILIRFFPVIVLEMKAIRDGILVRGIFPRWYSVLRHPVLAYECFFMPLIVRCLKLSAELSSSAEIRGIACNRMRTSIHPVGFTAVDGLVIGGFILMCTVIYWAGGVVHNH